MSDPLIDRPRGLALFYAAHRRLKSGKGGGAALSIMRRYLWPQDFTGDMEQES